MTPPKRGATGNPPNRFERLQVILDEEVEFEKRNPATSYFRDDAQTIISSTESPDIGFEASINPYRGCEHGCSYCYARPYHEYLGFSAGLDFETRILVKAGAPDLLRAQLSSPSWKPQVLAMSGVTDCYQPVERRLQITRRCLQVLAEFRNPVAIVTKNFLVTRDVDILADLAGVRAARVSLSITTLNADLARRLEPRASLPRHRLEAIRKLHSRGIAVSVLVAPVIPGLNEHEIPAILAAARRAGAIHAGYALLRLPHGVKEIFSDWLAENLPDARERILSRIRNVRGGSLNDSRFGIRMRGEGVEAEAICRLFEVSAAREGLTTSPPALSSAAFRRPGGEQLELL
ncbi:MAG TPA: PA0069 family radical SAM protein [Terrimicrobiaceae bacterium]|nr:PA0069 family radical SAM protein [Terrimicrobiaceae bacterium]